MAEESTGVRRVTPALGLFLLAPVTAEYLYGYDDSTGNLEELVAGLFLFAPLYGGAALLIRELTRRTGHGWPTILLAGLAFGVLQAGLIDHSLFNPSYRSIPYWDEMFMSSYVGRLGVNPNLALAFATGHMIWSIAAPVAIIEALVPRRRTSPWLGKPGLLIAAAGFVASAGFVVWWHLDQENFVPSAGQLTGAAAVAVALGATGLAWPRHRGRPDDTPAPRPAIAGAIVLALLVTPTIVGLTFDAIGIRTELWWHAESSWFLLGWAGLAWNLMILATIAALLVRWSRRDGWVHAHQAAVAGGALLANVAAAFAATPIGDVSTTAKYAHNTAGLLGVCALLVLAARRGPCRLASRFPAEAPGVDGPSYLSGST